MKRSMKGFSLCCARMGRIFFPKYVGSFFLMARTFAAKPLEYSGSRFFFGIVEPGSREASRLGAKAVFPEVNMVFWFYPFYHGCECPICFWNESCVPEM
jgi:hypothetical protein